MSLVSYECLKVPEDLQGLWADPLTPHEWVGYSSHADGMIREKLCQGILIVILPKQDLLQEIAIWPSICKN